MNKCTACYCFDREEKKGRGLPECNHPKANRNVLTCPLEIKHRLTPENSFAFVPYQIDGNPPVNNVYFKAWKDVTLESILLEHNG